MTWRRRGLGFWTFRLPCHETPCKGRETGRRKTAVESHGRASLNTQPATDSLLQERLHQSQQQVLTLEAEKALHVACFVQFGWGLAALCQEQNGAEQLRMNALLSQLQDKGFDPRSLAAFHGMSIILRACWASRKSTSAARMRRQNWRWRRKRNLLVSPPESPWGQQFLVGGARCREAAVKSVDQRTGGDGGLGFGLSDCHAMKRHVKAEKRGAEKLQLNHMACASLNTQPATDSLLQERLHQSQQQVLTLEAEKALHVACFVQFGWGLAALCQEQNGAEQLRMNALLSQLQDKGFDPRSLAAFHGMSIILRACWASRKSTSAARMRRQNWRWRRKRNLLVSPPESPWGQQFLVGGARCREAAVKSVDQRIGGDEGLGIGLSAFHAPRNGAPKSCS